MQQLQAVASCNFGREDSRWTVRVKAELKFSL